MTKQSRLIDNDLRNLGICEGDTLLLRAGLQGIGRISRDDFLDSLLRVLGEDGTLIGLSFTIGVPFWKLDSVDPFTVASPSYAGVLPNSMLSHPQAYRSKHPQCSIVAIGRHAKSIVYGHGPKSPAYEPIRRIIELKGKVAIIGCVDSSPGFTTAHLAEVDLNLHKRVVFPQLLGLTPYIDEDGERKVFHRRDPGLCSQSYWKFYSHYVRAKILRTGYVGNAYSILADAQSSYAVEKSLLSDNPKFTICENPNCVTCNMLRWDRLHKIPSLLIRRFYRLLKNHRKNG